MHIYEDTVVIYLIGSSLSVYDPTATLSILVSDFHRSYCHPEDQTNVTRNSTPKNKNSVII